eukprot:781335_1
MWVVAVPGDSLSQYCVCKKGFTGDECNDEPDSVDQGSSEEVTSVQENSDGLKEIAAALDGTDVEDSDQEADADVEGSDDNPDQGNAEDGDSELDNVDGEDSDQEADADVEGSDDNPDQGNAEDGDSELDNVDGEDSDQEADADVEGSDDNPDQGMSSEVIVHFFRGIVVRSILFA